MFSYSNLGIFFNLKSPRVLICGPKMESWVDSFKEVSSECICDMNPGRKCLGENSGTFDLIILNTCNLKKAQLIPCLEAAKVMLTAEGSLVTLVTHRPSIRNIFKRYIIKAVSPWHIGGSRSPEEHNNLLQQKGFHDSVGFIAQDSCAEYEFLSQINPTTLKSKGGKRYLFISGKKIRHNVNALLGSLQRLAGENGRGEDKLQLKDVELRPRGGGLLFLENESTCEEFVVRYGAHDHAVELNTNQAEIITKIYATQGLSVNLLNVIPKQYGTLDYSGFQLMMERKLPGDLAWKVSAKKKLEEVVLENACKFTFAFEKATRKEVFLDQITFDKMYREEFAGILQNRYISKEVVALYNKIVDKLEEQLVGKRQSLVLSHGDYGYGNILINDTGEITGVIDWEGARYRIPGYTLMNLFYSREKIVYGCHYEEIIEKVCKRSLTAGRIAMRFTNQYEEEFNLEKEVIGQVVATFCLLWVFYGARFKKGYSEKRALFFLSWALKNCF